MSKLKITSKERPSAQILKLARSFLKEFESLEALNGNNLLLFYDERSKSYYIPCHIKPEDLINNSDFNATIDGSDEDELYKLNRDITENQVAYTTMINDAKLGRTFEDIVVEYDKSYNKSLPLKIYGGQHRVKAIELGREDKPNTYHGLRVYFGLNKDQKVEIATINNTSITVPNDLLDRMKEQLLGPELREYFRKVGLLERDKDFADKKDSIIPTVRVARTFVVNYWKGKKDTEINNIPYVCKSGGIDEEYLNIRKNVKWSDKEFVEAGKKFALLHSTQREKVTGRKNDSMNQFASKAMSLAVVAAWGYTAGIYSNNKPKLLNLYKLTDNLGANEDPLNAKALSEARLQGIDPDTYRGLGARISSDELGRMLEVFLILIEKAKDKKISKNLPNAAIKSWEAKKATKNAEKMLSKI